MFLIILASPFLPPSSSLFSGLFSSPDKSTYLTCGRDPLTQPFWTEWSRGIRLVNCSPLICNVLHKLCCDPASILLCSCWQLLWTHSALTPAPSSFFTQLSTEWSSSFFIEKNSFLLPVNSGAPILYPYFLLPRIWTLSRSWVSTNSFFAGQGLADFFSLQLWEEKG